MANTFDPGKGTAWRYGQPIVAATPKTGNTGTATFWRYGQPTVIFTAVSALTLRTLAMMGMGQ